MRKLLDRRQNMLIGIGIGIVVVAASAYASGLSKLLLRTFHSSTEYKSVESAPAPALAAGDWINSKPLRLEDLRGRVVLIDFWTFGCYNRRRQISSLGISYPVVTDNDYKTWNAYKVEAWPTVFLLDKQGRIRWMHVGEGAYEETEQLIQ